MIDPARWRRVEELCHAALRLAAAERSSFLADACAGDEELRREVESLLAWEEHEARFLGESALGAAAHAVMGDSGALPIGIRLGAYEVKAWIGAGGMGEVYKAYDTRLNRSVAIKVLSSTTDPHIRTRFDREAKALAALTHPHICTLYDVGHHEGTDYLVMQELIGETLQDRLAKGALPLAQALAIAIEIADALDTAHRVGVFHRDLKPSNVMLTKTGSKLLDFGLAKTSSLLVDRPRPSLRTTTVTAQGTILGTPQYMSPEQIEGRVADARTDIFAFGVVLYEMITSKKAFEGKSQAGLIAAILEREPTPLSRLQPEFSAALDAVVKRCLAKDPDERWQTAGDLAAALRLLLEPAPIAQPPGVQTGTRHMGGWSRTKKTWTAMAAILGTTTIVLATLRNQEHGSAVEAHPVRFAVPPPEGASFQGRSARDVAPAAGVISPDGQKLAFTAADSTGTVLLWVRLLDSLAAQPLIQTQEASLPFWSPDSQWLGFFAQGKLKKVAVSGGLPQTLCDVREGWGGTWNRSETIVFATGGGLSRVSSAGGEAVAITTPSSNNYRFPYFLPDGSHFFYYVSPLAPGAMLPPPDAETGVHVGSLDSPDDRRLLESDSAAVYAPPGYVLFVREGTLFAQSFDAAGLQLKGELARLAEPVPFERNAPAFSVSDSGVLTYRTGPADPDTQLAWLDRSGKLIETVGTPGRYRGVDLSPDGTRIAVHRHDGSGGDVWVFEPRGTMTRLTFDSSQDNSSPIWSPDGDRIAFGSVRNGKWGLYLKHADGIGREELITESVLPKAPMAWSPDGKSIIYFVADPETRRDQWVIPVAGDRKPRPLLNSPFNEDHSQISPDGQWIAYASTETDFNAVYVKRFPSGNGKWPISTGGGVWPRWRRDGKEIFYLSGSKLMAAAVAAGGGRFEVGTPRELFDSRIIAPLHITELNVYAVSPDGQRFLIPMPAANNQGVVASTSITVTLNWASVLNR